MLRPKPLTY